MLRDPHDTESVFDIEDGLKDIEAYELAVEHLKAEPEVAAIMRERYLTDLVDAQSLAKLPEGTLGRAFAHHILDHGYDPDYFRKLEVKNDLDYVLMRMRQTHAGSAARRGWRGTLKRRVHIPATPGHGATGVVSYYSDTE